MWNVCRIFTDYVEKHLCFQDIRSGNWWSRYHKYTETEYKELVERFEKEEVPFSVAVVDMDWHLVEDVPPVYGSGWTGYTWNKKFFPQSA